MTDEIIFKSLDVTALEMAQVISVAISDDFTDDDFAKADGVIKAKVFLLNGIATTKLATN